MAQKTDIWMPLYIGDYLADTARLTTEQHGAYLLLIMDYWRSGKLPDNDQILAQITKLSPDAWSNAKAMLKQFFIIEDGFLIHKRIEQELIDAKDNKDKKHKRAIAGANARWNKDKNNANSNTNAMLKQCPSPLPLPLSINNYINAPKVAKPDGISDITWNDYLTIRKAQKKPITETALKGLEREALKAKISLEDALKICCERNWIGFKADWITNLSNPIEKKKQTNWWLTDESVLAKGRELGINARAGESMGQYKQRIQQELDRA